LIDPSTGGDLMSPSAENGILPPGGPAESVTEAAFDREDK
jgi:hypothetical protein